MGADAHEYGNTKPLPLLPTKGWKKVPERWGIRVFFIGVEAIDVLSGCINRREQFLSQKNSKLAI
jgi:hypothetical protein